MSMKTWKEKFYPVEPSKSMTKRKAVEHSLLKWRGLLSSNLEKHGLVVYGSYIQEDGNSIEDLRIDDKSCALCVKYGYGSGCMICPLGKHLTHPCDQGERSPYKVWRNSGDPKPMIKALRAVLKEMEK